MIEITTIRAIHKDRVCVFHVSPRLLKSRLFTKGFLDDMCRKMESDPEDTEFILADGSRIQF